MNRPFIITLIIAVIIVYFCSINVDTMDIDASQYASMSREMKENGSYLQIFDHGKDYLDKPPFLFWISSLSMMLFGDNNLAYKLPSILLALFAIYATFRFTKLFYNLTIAAIAAIVLATCQAMFLITNDVRTDTILMSFTMLAIWQLAEWLSSKKIAHFILGCIFIGLGMLTKGPIALIVPIFAFGSHFVATRNIKYLFKPIYLLGLLIIAIILLPMSIGLYQQFDLHPEKTVNDLQHVSGLRFFYWTQSFGRITGENVWKSNTGFSFLFENLLWGFIPWILFFIAGLIISYYEIIKNKCKASTHPEYISLGGFTLTYCALAISKMQLPHYIYIVLPLIAIITGKALYSILWEQQKYTIIKKIILPIQCIIIAALVLMPIAILKYTFAPGNMLWYIFPLVAVSFIIAMLKMRTTIPRIFSMSLGLIIIANFFLITWFYPNLLKYQSGNNAGRFVSSKNIAKDKFFTYKFNGSQSNIDFYAKRIVPSLNTLDNITTGTYILTMQEGMDDIQKMYKNYDTAFYGKDFHISQLTSNFLNAKMRQKELKDYFIVYFK